MNRCPPNGWKPCGKRPGASADIMRGRGGIPGWNPETDGTILGQLIRPLARVGVYVPGGRAAYPSVGADERDSRPGGRGGGNRDGDPAPSRREHPFSHPGGGAGGGRDGDLEGGRSPGDRRPGLRDGKHPAGGQDRRPRQHLRRLCEADGVRHGGHRHDRRAERNRRHRRRNGRSRIRGRRPPFPGGTRSDGQRRADHPFFRLGRTGFPGTGQTVRGSGAEGDRRPIPAGSRGDLSARRIWRRRWRRPTGWPPSIWSSWWPILGAGSVG